MLLREELEKREFEILSEKAVKSAESRGRRFPEENPFRSTIGASLSRRILSPCRCRHVGAEFLSIKEHFLHQRKGEGIKSVLHPENFTAHHILGDDHGVLTQFLLKGSCCGGFSAG